MAFTRTLTTSATDGRIEDSSTTAPAAGGVAGLQPLVRRGDPPPGEAGSIRAAATGGEGRGPLGLHLFSAEPLAQLRLQHPRPPVG